MSAASAAPAELATPSPAASPATAEQAGLLGKLKRSVSDVDWMQMGILVALFAGIWFLWDTPVVYPMKLLVVFFHESSHGLVAVLTGGKVLHLEVSPDEGGMCYTQGGSRFWTLTAGYLGSLFWGGLILTLAARTHYDRHIALVLGSVTLVVSLIFVRPFFGFGQLFTVLSGALLVGSGYFLPEMVNDVILRIIGLTSCLYVTLDIKSDIIDRSELRSDARMLEENTGIPTIFWGFVWIIVALVASAILLILASKPQAQTGNPDFHLPPALSLPTYHRAPDAAPATH